MKDLICKECAEKFNKQDGRVGAIYKESDRGFHVDYFICIDCLDVKKHHHKLSKRYGWTHLYGDISPNEHEWMEWVTSKTLDTICGKAGYFHLNGYQELCNEYK